MATAFITQREPIPATTLKIAPKRRPPERNRDWTLDECRKVAADAMPAQPNNRLFSTTPEELTAAIYFIAGGR
jgi:hypothetical protein